MLYFFRRDNVYNICFPTAVFDNEGSVCTGNPTSLTIQPLQNYPFQNRLQTNQTDHTHYATVSPLFLKCILRVTLSTESGIMTILPVLQPLPASFHSFHSSLWALYIQVRADIHNINNLFLKLSTEPKRNREMTALKQDVSS